MSKYQVGQTVRCYREETKDIIGFNFSGEILSVNDTEDGVEYIIENAPVLPVLNFHCLIWEEEIVGLVI